MNPEQTTNLLIEINGKVEVLLERTETKEKICDARLLLINDLNQRVGILEDFMKAEKTYRKLIIVMIGGLGTMIMWSISIASKVMDLLPR